MEHVSILAQMGAFCRVPIAQIVIPTAVLAQELLQLNAPLAVPIIIFLQDRAP